MTKQADRIALETFILNGNTHTLRSIESTYFGIATDSEMGLIDKALQRLRKRGAIRMSREGRSIFWTATSSPVG